MFSLTASAFSSGLRAVVTYKSFRHLKLPCTQVEILGCFFFLQPVDASRLTFILIITASILVNHRIEYELKKKFLFLCIATATCLKQQQQQQRLKHIRKTAKEQNCSVLPARLPREVKDLRWCNARELKVVIAESHIYMPGAKRRVESRCSAGSCGTHFFPAPCRIKRTERVQQHDWWFPWNSLLLQYLQLCRYITRKSIRLWK